MAGNIQDDPAIGSRNLEFDSDFGSYADEESHLLSGSGKFKPVEGNSKFAEEVMGSPEVQDFEEEEGEIDEISKNLHFFPNGISSSE